MTRRRDKAPAADTQVKTLEPSVGAYYRFELVGSRSSYSLTALVLDRSDTDLVLKTADGRRLTVPDAAVKSVMPDRPHRSEPPSAGQGASSHVSQGALARTLGEALRLSDSEEDALRRVGLLKSQIAEIQPSITSRLNRQRATAVLELAELIERELECSDYFSAATQRRQVLATAREVRVNQSVKPRPRSLTAELEKALQHLLAVEREYWATWADRITPPRILTRDRVNVTRGPDNEFDLPIRVSLDSDSAGVRSVRLVLDKFRNLKVIGAPKILAELGPGQSATLTARMRDNRKQGSKADVRIDAHLAFKDLAEGSHQSPRQTLDLRIHGKELHEEIPNPFRPYAGGLPVEGEDMFFGRHELIQELVRDLSKQPGGMCYALYGQQRTGKSSLLAQVKSKLTERGAVVASLSMGTIDRRSTTVDFIEEVLDQFRVQIDSLLPAELSSPLLARWPDSAAIEKRPLRSFQRAREAARTILRSAGHTGVPFVVVVDEFTYVHEVLRRRGIDPREHNELRDFMRQLKGLLEARLFSALLVGQDTMPRFLDAYPNEFSVMATRKLDYLSHDETQALADKPVLTPSKDSRYSGYALTTIATYTDGHPFFTQILCDRIISLVNSKRRADITQSDVEEAVEGLLCGQEGIEAHKFDCLVTADNTHSLIAEMGNDGEEDGSSHALTVLRRIAMLSGSQNHPVAIEDLQLDLKQQEALRDLRVRGVLRETEGGVAIRVLLFADYLRRRTV